MALGGIIVRLARNRLLETLDVAVDVAAHLVGGLHAAAGLVGRAGLAGGWGYEVAVGVGVGVEGDGGGEEGERGGLLGEGQKTKSLGST